MPVTADQEVVIDAIMLNSTRMRKEAQTIAFALFFLGIDAKPLCVWCHDKVGGTHDNCRRPELGGECSNCSYVGYDCLVSFV